MTDLLLFAAVVLFTLWAIWDNRRHNRRMDRITDTYFGGRDD